MEGHEEKKVETETSAEKEEVRFSNVPKNPYISDTPIMSPMNKERPKRPETPTLESDPNFKRSDTPILDRFKPKEDSAAKATEDDSAFVSASATEPFKAADPAAEE